MKVLFFILLLTTQVFAHDDDEVVVTKNAPRFGGRVSVAQSEKHHDKSLYMSEVIIADEGTVRIYFYDLGMKTIPLDSFPAELKAEVIFKKGKQIQKSNFNLKKEKGNYKGQLPAGGKKPFDLSIEMNVNQEDMHLIFKKLD